MSNTSLQAERIPFSITINKPNYQAMINRAIQDPEKAKRFVSAIVSAVSVNPGLQACTPQTILSGALLGESLNLSPSPQLGQYYLVPFEDKKAGVTNAAFVLGYKGLTQLALRSGQYKKLNVVSVKDGELENWNPVSEGFTINPILDDMIRENAKTIGYLATFEYLNGFTKTIYWSKNKMALHADRYSPAFSLNGGTIKTRRGPVEKVSFADYEAGNYPPGTEWLYSSFWYKDFDGMAHKTMLRQLISKWGIMSIEMQNAFEGDEKIVNAPGEYIQPEDFASDELSEDGAAAESDDNYETPQEAQQEGKVNLSDL